MGAQFRVAMGRGTPPGVAAGTLPVLGVLGEGLASSGLAHGVGVSGRALGEGRQAGGSCVYRVSAFPAPTVPLGCANPMGSPWQPQLKRRPAGLARAAGPGWVFRPPALRGVLVAHG